jgi:glycerol uptake facilitator-like aquaporin
MLERFAPKALAEQGDRVELAVLVSARMLVAEAIGAGVLTFLVVAAGILSERYAGGNIALAILTTALAAAAGFAAMARALGPLAPSLFNPAFAFALAVSGRLPLFGALLAGGAQMAAACAGVMIAHMVTNTGRVQVATQIQTGLPVWLGEFIAAALVVFVLLRLTATASRGVPLFGGLALLAAALATPSLSLANPAITLARGLTDSFTSIRLEDAGLIVACQLAGALAATLASAALFPAARDQLPR